MGLTPVEIRHVRLRRGLLGYRRRAVDDLLDDVVASFEDVWRERADLADRVEQLEGEVGRHRELESLLRATMMSAEQAANDFREQARREAELIVNEAHSTGRSIMRRAAEERERLVVEAQRVRAILEGALAAVDEAIGDAEPAREPEAA
jgi:cell division initiation protein